MCRVRLDAGLGRLDVAFRPLQLAGVFLIGEQSFSTAAGTEPVNSAVVFNVHHSSAGVKLVPTKRATHSFRHSRSLQLFRYG